MKKLIYCAAALATALFAGSCQQELLDMPAGENTVTYTVEVPGVATKAIADGKNVNRLYYEVYMTDDNTEDDLSNATLLYKKDITMITSQEATSRAIVTLNLVQNQNYTVLFWAQCDLENPVYNVTDLRNVTYKSGATVYSNHEDYAAFYSVDYISDSTPRDKKVYLQRPFAQLNIGTTINPVDYNKDPYRVALKNSKVTVKNVPTKFNVATSAVAGDAEFTFTMEEVIKNENLVVNNTEYNYVAMNYMFAGANRTATVEYWVEADVTTQNNVPVQTNLNKSVVNVPLKENYRTNIVGNLLTSSTEYEVIVDADWAGDDLAPDPLFMAAANGGEFTLTEDVELSEPLKIQAPLVLDLNGYTISAVLKQEGRHHYAIDNYAHLTLVGSGAINARGVQNFGTMVIDGDITITNVDTNGGSAIWNEGDLVINNGTFTTNPNAGAGSYGGALSTQTGGSAVINGGNFKSYSQLTYAICNYGETIINDATVTGKHGAVASNTGCETVINAGSFSLLENPGVSDHCAYFVSSIKGGSFTLGNNTDAGAQVFYESTIADGYKATQVDDNYIVTKNDVTVATTAAAVKDVFANGGTVVLAADIKFENITSIEPGAEVHLNLNGQTITVDENTTSNTLFYVKDGGKLIIDGNGIVDLGAVSTMAVFAPYGELVIENGTFIRDEVTEVTTKTTGLFMGAKTTASKVTINGGYFDPGYYNEDAAVVEEILAGTKEFVETDDDIAKRGNSKDANKVRVALKENVSVVLNHSGYGEFKIYGGTFVGANPAWGDEGCMLPTTPNYLRPWSYYQGALLDGQTFNENGLVIPDGYEITKGATNNGIPTYTVTYNK